MYVSKNEPKPNCLCHDCQEQMRVEFVARLMNPNEGYFQVTCDNDVCALEAITLPLEQYEALTAAEFVTYRHIPRTSTEDAIRINADHRQRLAAKR